MSDPAREGIVQRIVRAFVTGPLSLLLLVVSSAAGAVAVLATPRIEEEPQTVVPTADVLVSFHGACAEEVEKLVSTPLEKLLWQCDGVEHGYSISRRDGAVVTVRFVVGEDRERALVRLQVNWIEHDLDVPLALTAGYALILVVRFMNLPLIAGLSAWLAPDGILMVEQHLVTTAEVAGAPIAGPTDPAFRVQPGELRQLAQGLRVLCYEETLTLDPDQRPVALARLVAQTSAKSILTGRQRVALR